MNTTANLREWFESAPCHIESIITFNSSNLHEDTQQSKYYSLLRNHFSTDVLNLRDENFTASLHSHQINNDRSIIGAHIKPISMPLNYFSFGVSDDKYFLLNGSCIGYQDTLLYSDFYNTLPSLKSEPVCIDIHNDELIILPRAQYGHFIFDEVLPPLISYACRYNQPPKKIVLLQSRSWQHRVISSLCQLLFDGQESDVRIFKIPSSSQRYLLHGGLLTLSSPLATYFDVYRRQIQKNISKVNTRLTYNNNNSIVMLTREGFDDITQRRIVNYPEIFKSLSHLNVKFVRPHEHNILELSILLADASIVISEPGTTPLIGYLTAPSNAKFINLLSERCLFECQSKYFYSGWRYHLAWLPRLQSVVWGRPVKINSNPFSDHCAYSVIDILSSIHQ